MNSASDSVPVVWEPNQISAAFEAAFNSGDVKNLQSLYEANPVLVAVASSDANRNSDGTARDWHSELAALVGSGGTITCNCVYALQHSNVALVSAAWRVTGLKDANGGPLPDISGRSVEIVRR